MRVAKGAPIRVAARVTETRVAFEVTAPQRVAPVVHRHCLGRWHLDMVADARRNAASIIYAALADRFKSKPLEAGGAALATEKPGAKLDDASIATGAALKGKPATTKKDE